MEFEKSILGSFLIDKKSIEHIESLSENDFTVEIHKILFKESKDLAAKNKLDVVHLIEKSRAYGINSSYISELTISSQPGTIVSQIKTLKEKTKYRKLTKLAENIIDDAGEEKDIHKIIYNFESAAKSLADSDSDIRDDAGSIYEKFIDFMISEQEENIKFGIEFLDKVIGGLFRGELTTIAAKSGVGKTALALQIARAALKHKKKVLLISREMSDIQMFMRNITSLTGISPIKIKNKDLTEEEEEAIHKAAIALAKDNKLYINDNISTVAEIKRRIRQVRPDLVIIDYLQLLTPGKSEASREREVATLSREIKNMTLDFNLPIIQLSQLNDELKDSRPYGERPMRDSKAIYHDSNNVIYIHEPLGKDLEDACEEYGLNISDVKSSKERGCTLLDLIVAKCRDGGKSIDQHWYVGERLYFQKCIGGGRNELYKRRTR